MDTILEMLLNRELKAEDEALFVFAIEYKKNHSAEKAFKKIISEKKLKKSIKSNDYSDKIGGFSAFLTTLARFMCHKDMETDEEGRKFLLNKLKEYIQLFEENLETEVKK